MKLDNFLDKTIKITQIKSGLKLNKRQKKSLIGLGLRGIGTSSEVRASISALGMIEKIKHTIKIS